MGGLTGAVHWWEESQLRVLVLTSMVIQFLLFCFPILRRHALPGWFRFIMWLAYHGGDAVAIYGLATLFNRHKDEGDGGVGGGNRLLEVVWAPVLLIHLGGHDGVTAYNIEDNELWTRHLLTAASQVTVAVYAFCKSWPAGGDKRLLQTAILLFTIGVVKCFVKALAFKRASIYSLVTSDAAANQINHGNMCLEEYVKQAGGIVIQQQQEDQDPGTKTMTSPPRVTTTARQLFVDLSSSYPHRIRIFTKFWGLSEEKAYDSVQEGLASAFFLLYTKLKTTVPYDDFSILSRGYTTLYPRMLLPWASIGLFHHSNRESYHDIDVKVTYAILCCTALLETYSTMVVALNDADGRRRPEGMDEPLWEVWPQTVAQYSLAGYFVRNKKHSIKMGIVSFVGCKDILDQQWCMEPCFSSARITSLVLRYLKDGWKQKIQDAASYRSFNNHSSRWVLNMNRQLDEWVLLWHLATDFCFFSSRLFAEHRCHFVEPKPREAVSVYKGLLYLSVQLLPWKRAYVGRSGTKCSEESAECKSVQCRQMSNYMVYLLFVNPEMLLPGSRRNLFKMAYDQLRGILNDREWNPVCWSRCAPCGVKQIKEEAVVMEELNKRMKEKAVVTEIAITVMQQNSERASQEGSSMKGFNRDESFIHQAWDLAQELMKKDEMEMWKEIQDVWVQMLCFSASRCRGYLHAKALGKGGEFLSYVWLLLFYMGMETFPERLQRELVPIYQGNNDTTPPPTFEVRTTSTTQLASTVHTCANTGTTASTSEICAAQDNIV